NKEGDARGWVAANISEEAKAPKAASAPAAFVLAKVQHVYYRGDDGQIHELFRADGQKWGHAAIGADAKAPKAAGDQFDYADNDLKTQHVAYRGADGAVVELANAGKGWSSKDISADAKAPVKAAGTPAAFVVGKVHHVFFRGADDQIHEMYRGGEK